MPDPILTPEDWIRQSASARDRLIAEHGMRPDFFHVVEEDDEPCLGWAPIYPKEWGEGIVFDPDGTLVTGWVRYDAVPVGLVLYWPPGIDVTGEAFDPDDPILYLQHLEMWEKFSPEADEGPADADQG
jgi:hypothetical protein